MKITLRFEDDGNPAKGTIDVFTDNAYRPLLAHAIIALQNYVDELNEELIQRGAEMLHTQGITQPTQQHCQQVTNTITLRTQSELPVFELPHMPNP